MPGQPGQTPADMAPAMAYNHLPSVHERAARRQLTEAAQTTQTDSASVDEDVYDHVFH